MIIAQSALEAILTKDNVHQTAYIIMVIIFETQNVTDHGIRAIIKWQWNFPAYAKIPSSFGQ